MNAAVRDMNAAVQDMNAAVRDMNAVVRRSYVDPCRGRGLLFQASACECNSEGGRILYGLYMDEASTAASTEANTRVRRCMACASSQREGGRIGQGGRIHYFNYSFGYQDTNTKIPRSVLWTPSMHTLSLSHSSFQVCHRSTDTAIQSSLSSISRSVRAVI